MKLQNVVYLRIIFVIVILHLSSLQLLFAQCQQLVWSDEFDGTSLDLTKWTYQTGDGTNYGLDQGWGNSERQYYTSRTQNVNVANGYLEITARSENYLGAQYTSGRIRSANPLTGYPLNEWQYGSFEARIQVPEPFADSRVWPAFWMLPHDGPWPNTGEIDILETSADGEPWKFHGTLHYFSGAHQNSGTGGVTINTSPPCPGPNGDLSTCFHVYRVDWSPNSIKWFVDGVQVGITRNNTNTIGGAWPFDAANKFHLILNMAVGGWFPGTQAPNNARFPLTMLVDYVRVYSNPSATQITGKAKVMQGDNGITYSVTADPSSTFNWSVPSGATIVSGQGTNQITVNYGSSASSGNISVEITPTGAGCVPVTINLPVTVLANTCTLTLEDFESSATRNLGYNFSTGWMNRNCTSCESLPYGYFANPGTAAPNTSANVGKYERNGGVQYDVLAYNDIAIGDASIFRNGLATFQMDVRSTAPAGTTVMVQLENSVRAQTGWPNGIYARYTATTGAANTWNRLTFTLLDTPDGPMQASEVDQLILFFNPNSFTSHTYYFDNFRRIGTTPATSAITGSSSVCQNNVGQIYSVTGSVGSTFNWSVPAGASIVSGQGSNSITVNFGTTSGNVSVMETNAVNCTGLVRNLAVSITGPCTLTSDFSANPLSTCSGSAITFTDLTTGKTGGETYSWDFGAGASLPSGTTGAGPHQVTYSTGGTKTVSLTVSKGGTSDSEIKNNYITITGTPSGCLFSDHFDNTSADWLSAGAFSHAEASSIWTVSNSGHAEWDNWIYTLNNGTVAEPINFACPQNKPVLRIRARASANALLRIAMVDGNGRATDNVPSYNLELTTAYQDFTIDYASHLRNYYSGSPGYLDTANITGLQFFVNPGYISFPYAGVNKTYNSAFTGTVDIEWMGIGDNSCNALPVDLLSFTVNKTGNNTALLSWVTATEEDNDYFEIARSTDGINFTTIANLGGVGNSLVHNKYTYADNDLKSGIYYYQLRQVDIDGKLSVLSTKVIHFENSIHADIIPSFVTKGETVKLFNFTNDELEYVLITDLTGNEFAVFHNINTSYIDIHTRDFLPGLYLVKIISGNQMLVKRMVVY